MKMSQSFNPERARALRIIRRIDNSLLKNRNKRLADFDLTAAQSDIVVYLMNNYQEMSEINQLDIQKHLQLSNPTVSGLLNRLEEKGFISRTSSIHDARYNCIMPTQKALIQTNSMIEHMYSSEDSMLAGLSDAEKEELFRLLSIVLENVEKEDAENQKKSKQQR